MSLDEIKSIKHSLIKTNLVELGDINLARHIISRYDLNFENKYLLFQE